MSTENKPESPQGSVAEGTQQPKPRKTSKKFIGIGLLVLIAIGSFGYWLWAQQSSDVKTRLESAQGELD